MNASLQTLIQCFEQTLSPDPNVRRRAELDLRNVEKNPGFLGAVLTVVSDCENASIRQASAVYLKNSVKQYWDPEKGAATVSDQEKDDFRARLIPVMVNVSLSARTQLAHVLQQVLVVDYPDRWPTFLQQTLGLLQEQNVPSVYAGLICLLELSKVYRWRSKERREGLDEIIRVTFPTLLQISNGLSLEDSEIAGDMMRVMLKIYKNVIWLELPAGLQDMSSLVPWGQLLLKIVTKPLTADIMAQDSEAREMHVWWKAKKWAYFSLDRLFQRYGDPTQLSGEANRDYEGFAKMFSTTFAPEILRCYLGQVQSWASDSKAHWLSSRSLFFIGSFFACCVKPKVTWALLKDNVDSLIEHFVFPQICHSEDDLALWQSDPQEYISKRIDIYEDFASPDVAATSFLLACCERKKTTCFMHTLNFINKELSQYASASPAEKDPIRKEAALRMTGNIAHIILKPKSPVRPMMEQFFVTHVFPEFNSEYGYLRARACQMMNAFADIDFQDQQNLAIAYQGVMKCLTEQELPVRVEAALALHPLIRQDFIHNAMVESIPQIMKVMLQLANEVDVDSLSNVMEEFVEVFANELTPYAVELAEQLRDTFMRIMMDSADQQGRSLDDDFEWDNMDDKSLAALGILNTIGTLILSLENTPEALYRLEETVLPVINFVLQKEIMDLYAEIFEIIDSCTFSAKAISPTMWGVFGTIHATFKKSGMDYIDELLPSLENYVTYGSSQMIGNSTSQMIIFDIIQGVFTNHRLGVQDRLAVTKLAQIFLLQLKGHIDQYLHPLMTLFMNSLSNPNEPKSGAYRLLLIEALVNCIYYNPIAALQYLESHGGTPAFLSMWFSSLSKFLRVHDKKLMILTIISMLSLPVEQIPASVRPGWTQLSTALLEIFSTFPEALARRELAQQKLSNEDSDYWRSDPTQNEEDGADAEEDWDEADLDDGDFKDEGTEYLDFLGEEAKRLAKQVAKKQEDEAGDDGEDYDDEEMSEDVLFVSPIEDVDAYIAAKNFFQNLHESNAPYYTELTSHLSAEQQAQFQSVMSIAENNRALLVAKQQGTAN